MNVELNLAESIARAAHSGQKRKDGKTPYIEHPQAVAAMVKHPNQKIVAWLHDVLEDTPLTAAKLMHLGISAHNVESIVSLTRQPRESYYNFIMRVSGDGCATIVKIADLTHNLSDLPDGNLRDKYLFARHVLQLEVFPE